MNDTMSMPGDGRTIDERDLVTWIRMQAEDVDRYVFGIAGPPGSGKSTVANRIGSELGAPVVPMDGFHLTNEVLRSRGVRDIKGAPETFAATAFVDLVRTLRDPTRAVSCPIFDRTIDEPIPGLIEVSPEDDVVIVEGNYLLLDRSPWSALPALFDAVAYLEVSDEVRVERLVARHVAFGRGPDEAAAFVSRSDQANARLVEASRTRADLVVRGGG